MDAGNTIKKGQIFAMKCKLLKTEGREQHIGTNIYIPNIRESIQYYGLQSEQTDKNDIWRFFRHVKKNLFRG